MDTPASPQQHRGGVDIEMLDSMSVGDWVTIILTIPLSVLSIFVYGWIRSGLERRKLVKTDQTRQQAIRAFNTVKAFHNRTRDRYAYYLIVVGWAVICAVASGTMLILLFVLHPDIRFDFSPDSKLNPGAGVAILFLLTMIFALLSVISMISIYSVSRRLGHFDSYKKEMEDRWGPLE
jgi:flagellar biosynthesis protein FlhB